MQYLLKWEGFPMDECTWEPTVNLGEGLLETWHKNKEEIQAGKREPFDLEIYHAAYKAKEERHKRRNAKRKRLGLPPTRSFSPEFPELPELTAQEATSPATTREEPGLDVDAQETDAKQSHPTPKAKPEEAAQQKTTKPTAPAARRKSDTNIAPGSNRKKPKRASMPGPPSKSTQPPPEPKRPVSSSGTASTTITGYQGTARKPSTKKNSGPLKSPVSKASTQKAPSSTSKPPLTQPPKLTSSLANKFAGKKLTATRTRPQPRVTATSSKRPSNVFVSGKERKKRASLGDVMDDPSKAPKAFNSMRVMNIAKKRGIERNDAAGPDFSSIPASFFLTNNRENPPSTDETKSNVPSAPPKPPPIVQSPTAISPSDESAAAVAPKPKKSVRFTGEDDAAPEDEPMGGAMDVTMGDAIDLHTNEPTSLNPSLKRSEVSKPPLPAKRLSLVTYQERGQSQVVQKAAIFGKASTSESVRVLFNGIVRQNQPWLAAFIAQEALKFESICTSYDFLVNKDSLVEEVLSVGTIESTAKEVISALMNVAGHLRRGSYGCHLITEQFSILVYPSGCESWKGLGVDAEKYRFESPALRYMIYRSSVDVRLYPPATVPRAPTSISRMTQESHCRVLIKDLVGLDFSQLLPQESDEKDNQVFMLIFPKREIQLCNILKLWLRSCQPNCRIFSHEYKDSWTKFHETVRACAAGTIIMHEDVGASIRKLPRVSQIIEYKRCYTFWNVATGRYDPPVFPSDERKTIEPGTLQLTRLFPHGRVFLITPSFALSDPARLCYFLKWFKRYCCNPHYLLVACADFPNYLKAITLEKAQEHEVMCARYSDNNRLEERLAESGLSKTDLDSRFKAWELLMEIMEEYGDEETSEEIRKVYWITDFIDPNDEQSLVNWFCSWSAQRCDQFRKFTVLGSSNGRHKAAYRHIKIPVYTEETVSDPDVALDREDQQRRVGGDPHAASNVEGLAQGVGPHASLPGNTPMNDRPVEIKGRLIYLANRYTTVGWAGLHVNPVSWLNVPMADHFGDSRCQYDTFKNWLGKAPKIGFGPVNTWYGLFYTIDKEWNPQAPAHTYGRHPWIAVFRPVNPHKLKTRYDEIELFIWDINAHDKDRISRNAPLLSNMQQHLVNVVREELPLKNQKLFLEKVYISSKTNISFHPNDSPLERTYQKLQEMLTDGKTWLPPFENMLPNRGWKSLPQSQWRNDITTGTLNPPAEKNHTIPLLSHDYGENQLRKSIWHAPSPKYVTGKTRCINHLYEAALEVRREDPSSREMKYQYRSTLDWYHDMKVEGRDASHVNVDSADKILQKLVPLKK